MKPLALLALLLCSVGMNTPARAEGGCPPGWMPYGGTGMGSCGLIPGGPQSQQVAPRAPQWQDRWGAIATDEPRGVLGSATGMPNKASAELFAMADCGAKGGKNCELETWYRNGCAVLVVGDGGYNVTARTTLDQATAVGMNYCTDAKRTNCRVYFSACSPPERIR